MTFKHLPDFAGELSLKLDCCFLYYLVILNDVTKNF